MWKREFHHRLVATEDEVQRKRRKVMTRDERRTFENQNQRAKVRLELSEGVLVEVPLAVIVRAIQEQHMAAKEGGITFGGETDPTPAKTIVHWAFPDFWSDEEGDLVHFIVTTHEDARERIATPSAKAMPHITKCRERMPEK